MDRCCFPLSLASAGGLGPTLVADPGLRLLPPALASGASGLLPPPAWLSLGLGQLERVFLLAGTHGWSGLMTGWPNGGPTQTVIVPWCPVWRRTTWGEARWSWRLPRPRPSIRRLPISAACPSSAASSLAIRRANYVFHRVVPEKAVTQ